MREKAKKYVLILACKSLFELQTNTINDPKNNRYFHEKLIVGVLNHYITFLLLRRRNVKGKSCPNYLGPAIPLTVLPT